MFEQHQQTRIGDGPSRVLGAPPCLQHGHGRKGCRLPRVRYVPTPEAPREVHVRQVTLSLRGETPPRRARVRAAAAAAAASSGPIGTIGLL